MIRCLNSKDEFQNHGFIKVYNRGAFVLRFAIAYFINGEFHRRASPEITVLWDYTLNIPPKARNIEFAVQIALFFDTWKNIYYRKFNSPVQKCFTASGITLYAICNEVICPDSNRNILNHNCCN